MTCLCWSSNLLVQIRLTRRNKAASQGHFKKDNSPCQNMLDLDWECLTLQKQVCWQTSLPCIFHAMSYKDWGVTAGGEFRSPALTTSAVACRPCSHTVMGCESLQAEPSSKELCVETVVPPLAPAPFPVGGRLRPRWGILLQELPHRAAARGRCIKYIKNSKPDDILLSRSYTVNP